MTNIKATLISDIETTAKGEQTHILSLCPHRECVPETYSLSNSSAFRNYSVETVQVCSKSHLHHKKLDTNYKSTVKGLVQ